MKQTLATYSADQRKKSLIQALKKVKSDTALTLCQFNQCLRILENIALSPRISDLNRHGYYSRIVDGWYPHVHSMNGLACYLRSFYPDEEILFAFNVYNSSLNCMKSFTKTASKKPGKFIITIYNHDIALSKIQALSEKKPVFIVYEYPESEHKMLIMFQKESTGYVLRFFDSLGINPWNRMKGDEPFYYEMQSLVSCFSRQFEPLRVEASGITRQKDHTHCGAFIVFDFKIAISLLKEGKSLFIDKSTPDPAFFEISQRDEDIDYSNSTFHRSKDNQRANLRASILALDILKFYLKTKTHYPEPTSQKEGDEEKSEEDTEGCVIM